MFSVKLLKVVFFTEKGKALADRIFNNWDQAVPAFKEKDEQLDMWVQKAFEEHQPILFIGATGIAVRKIAPFLQNKLIDSSVVVIDELGQFVIPLLSGHYGGANELASLLAGRLGATPVITTATDINKAFAIDVFARENGLFISDKDKIKRISSKILRGEKVLYKCDVEDAVFIGKRPELVQEADAFVNDKAELNDDIQDSISKERIDFSIEDGEKAHQAVSDSLRLFPKRMVLGIGCKKGKSYEDLKAFVLGKYDEDRLRGELYAICSIDLKQREPGLIMLSQYLGVPFITYTTAELEEAPGTYEESDFVKKAVGVGNVCERAAMLGAGSGAEIVIRKTAGDGMTLAESRRKKIEIRWQEK